MRTACCRTGEHTYTLSYRTDRQLGYFENHDELYWNVTGTGWMFPIDAASARVRLPAAVAAAQIAVEGYTGTFRRSRVGTTAARLQEGGALRSPQREPSAPA